MDTEANLAALAKVAGESLIILKPSLSLGSWMMKFKNLSVYSLEPNIYNLSRGNT
jgi:hypothetical protein